MSNSSTPTNTSEINDRRSNQHSPHSSVKSSPPHENPHENEIEIENENDNLFGSEQNSPPSEHVGSDREVIQRKRVKRRIVESPSQDSSRNRSSSSSRSMTPIAKSKAANSKLFSEKRLIKESPWEITDADTLKGNSDNEDIDDLFGGAGSDEEEKFEQ